MIKVGDTISRPYVFTRETIKLFADETGDTNPLHAASFQGAAAAR
jgi:acyl dehydratase